MKTAFTISSVAISLGLLIGLVLLWPSIKTLKSIETYSKLDISISITFDKNTPSYKYTAHADNLVIQSDQLMIPSNTAVQFTFSSLDKVYYLSSDSIGFDGNIVPGMTHEHKMTPKELMHTPNNYTIRTDKDNASFKVEIVNKDSFLSTLKQSSQ